MSPEEFALRLGAARARAAALREEAIRELGASVVAAIAAAGRRLASALRATRTPPARREARDHALVARLTRSFR